MVWLGDIHGLDGDGCIDHGNRAHDCSLEDCARRQRRICAEQRADRILARVWRPPHSLAVPGLQSLRRGASNDIAFPLRTLDERLELGRAHTTCDQHVQPLDHHLAACMERHLAVLSVGVERFGAGKHRQ